MSTLDIDELAPCFEGLIPAVIATADNNGVPNITYLSRVMKVDDEHVALSNQFFSKTSRNLAVNPRASVLLLNPLTFAEFRISIEYERSERRGPIFERMREDIDAIAALTGMSGVFALKSAEIYRVTEIVRKAPSGVA